MSTATSTCDAIQSLQATLEPLSELHGEHSQLEAWVNGSCQALEKLHGDLAEWQNELARKQTDLDLREDALEKCQLQEEELGTQVTQWKTELSAAQEEARQLGEESADQLQQLEQLERRCIELEAELKLAEQRHAELQAMLDAERAHRAKEQEQWKEEFKGMRELLDKQCTLLATQIIPGEKSGAAGDQSTPSARRSQELRRRAQERLASKRRELDDLNVNDQETEES